MKSRSRHIAIAFGSLLTLAAFARQDPDTVELLLEPVSGSVSCLYGRGGNIGVSHGPDGLLIVDDQFDWLAPKIEERLAELADEGPRFVLNTHFHGDHTGGNAHFGRTATIIAHENVRRRLAEGLGGRGREVPPAPAEALPVVTYPGDGGLSLHFNGEEIRLFHIPSAHTDGDSAVWFTGSGVLHLGDTFFAGRFPFVDVASGGDVRGLIAGIERVLEEVPEDIRIIPGHGDVCGVAELRVYLEVLRECARRVSEALADGRTLEEMRSMQLLGDYAPTWGAGFIDADGFLGALVGSLGGQ